MLGIAGNASDWSLDHGLERSSVADGQKTVTVSVSEFFSMDKLLIDEE